MKLVNHTSSGENLIGILLSMSIGFALILFSSGRTNAQRTEIPPAISSISKRIRVQEIYTSQIGVREKHPNAGNDIEKYLRYVSLSKGNPWCAAFVCWALGEAGVENPRMGWSPGLFPNSRVIWTKGQAESFSRFAYPLHQTSDLRPQASNKPAISINLPSQTSDFRLPTSDPQPKTADIFGLYFPEKGRVAHVGFIDQWDGTWMISVEGNTNVSGGREGDGVYRKRRLVRTVYKVARYVGMRESRFEKRKR